MKLNKRKFKKLMRDFAECSMLVEMDKNPVTGVMFGEPAKAKRCRSILKRTKGIGIQGNVVHMPPKSEDNCKGYIIVVACFPDERCVAAVERLDRVTVQE